MSWTSTRIDLLKKLWTDGESASAIASSLGGVTRNAVIGKVHRLGLQGRRGASRAQRSARRAAIPPRIGRCSLAAQRTRKPFQRTRRAAQPTGTS